jgi:hypothetical protein
LRSYGHRSFEVLKLVLYHNLGNLPEPLLLTQILLTRHGGYLVANWDERNNSIKMPVGVEIASGSWDLVASAENQHPCMAGGDASLNVVVRKDYACHHGLEILEELGFDQYKNPLEPFSDADLQVELENRGYRVELPNTSLF